VHALRRAAGVRGAALTLAAGLVLTAALALTAGLALTAPPLLAQTAPDAPRIPRAVPSRADSMLAVGRLAAAEEALYAAVEVRPRAPEPRGALGAYLASRGRFRIATVLLEEAQRFGADRGSVQRMLAAFAPYTASVASGPVVTVVTRPTTSPGALAAFPVRAGRGASEEFVALLDPRVHGVVLGRGAAQAFGVRAGGRGRVLDELWIGERRLERLEARVDSLESPDAVRIGLDVLWGLHVQVDERASTLTLGRAPNVVALGGPVEQIPFVLTFPGMFLVPQVGRPPVPIESAAGRALLRGTRWQIFAAQSTVVVER
jgi:hypothetical protein